MNTNCNGVVIRAQYGEVTIGVYDQYGNLTAPCICIDEDSFEIFE